MVTPAGAAIVLSGLLQITGQAAALNNGMGAVPPLGWNSWCTDVSCTKDYCDEKLVHAQVDAIVTRGLRDIGWKYITLDDCWGGERHQNGSYWWDEDRFPSGIPALADYVHANGMLLGLYLGSGNQTCNRGGRPYPVPGSLGRYDDDALTMAHWNVDYIKLDWCGFSLDGDKEQCGPNITEPACKEVRFKEFSKALNTTGRPIYLAASSVIGTPDWAPSTLNSWRIGGDHHDWWWTNNTGWMRNSSTRYKIDNLNRANHVEVDGKAIAGPGHWNDADFIFTGGQGCGTATGDNPPRNSSTLKAHCPMQTDHEYLTAFSMWAIGTAPLLVAVDVANMTRVEEKALMNPAVAAMHLDPLGVPGRRIAIDTSCKSDVAPNVLGTIPVCQIWMKPLTDGSYAVALYNSEPDQDFLCGDTMTQCSDGSKSNCCMVKVKGARSHSITVSRADLDVPTTWSSLVVHDLWAGTKVTTKAGAMDYTAKAVPPSGVVLLQISKA